MPRRREAEKRHARDYEDRLHDRWRADDGLREETDRRYAERLALKEDLARANERDDAVRRYRHDDLQRIEDQRPRAEEECRLESQQNRELLRQIERLQLSSHQRGTLQVNRFLS